MNTWVGLAKDEKLTILANVAQHKGIVDNAVEKDYWVSVVLRTIFSLPYASAFVFKGGTSLSKGWALIDRFSEDIDLAIDPQFLGLQISKPKANVPSCERSLRNLLIAFWRLILRKSLTNTACRNIAVS